MGETEHITGGEFARFRADQQAWQARLEAQLRDGFGTLANRLDQLNGRTRENKEHIIRVEAEMATARDRESAMPGREVRSGVAAIFLRWWPVIALALTWGVISLSAFYSMRAEVAQIRTEAAHAGATAKAAVVAHEEQQKVTANEQARRLEAIEKAVTELWKTWEGRK